jgi:tRNA A-37 threonylcarbamoyl transferase component Bud32
VLGRFRLLRVLGQGSFASAYLAEQHGTERKAVVKIAHPHLIRSEQGKMVRDRFASEVRAATRVTHPNLVTIYTAGETDEGLPALAMEYLEGETLGQLLLRGDRLAIDELILGFTHLASALQRVHASQIIHRDVSPENVFLTRGPDGFAVKLLDFGIARLQDRVSSGKFSVGTPFYMAPEQMRGEAQTASDVYSVGALLWWTLTGQEVFAHITELPQLFYQLQTQQEAPDPLTVCPTLPRQVARLVSSMLHHEAAQRPTMGEFLVEWAAVEPELRRWAAPLPGRQVSVVLTPGLLDSMVTGMLQEQGHIVQRQKASVSALLAHEGLEAVVIDANLAELDALSLARHVSQVLPHVQLCVVSTRPFAPAWSSVPQRLLALLPEELPRLREAIRDGLLRPGSAVVSAEYAHLALGEIPEQLASLEETAGRDPASAVYHCERIERIAHLAALSEMGSLARTMRVLLAADAVDDPGGFIEELKRSFHASFAELLAAQNQGDNH